MEAKMKALQFNQLLNLTKKTLDSRLRQYYKQTKQAAYVVQCAVVILIRNAFSPDDFSEVAKSLIRKLFIHHPNELASVRHLCIYFRSYFSDTEWAALINDLFDSEDEYLQVTQQARLHTDHLQPALHSGRREVICLKNLALTFFDESGKKHRCTMKNVERIYTTQENCDLLSILGTLTIFEHRGVRRFAQLAKAVFVTPDEDYNHDSPEKQAQPWVETPQAPQPKVKAEKTAAKVTPAVPAATPKQVTPADLRAMSLEERKAFLFEGIDIDRMPQDELFSRTITALLEGIPVKDAEPKAYFDEESTEEIDELMEDLLTITEDAPDKPAEPETAEERRKRLRREQRERDKMLRKAGVKKKKRRKKRR